MSWDATLASNNRRRILQTPDGCANGTELQMPKTGNDLAALREVNQLARFNSWLGLEVVSASPGEVELRLAWREELGQYSGYLHAGIIAALLDTACGFAAYTLSGWVLASQLSVKYLRPAVADTFIVRGRVIKPGRQQVFAAAELASLSDPSKPLAIGDTLLVPSGDRAPGDLACA